MAFIHKSKSAWAAGAALLALVCLSGCNNQEILRSLEKKSEEAAILSRQLSETESQISQQEFLISQKDQEIGQLKKEFSEADERIRKTEEKALAEQKTAESEKQALSKKVRLLGDDVNRLEKLNRTTVSKNSTLREEKDAVMESAKNTVAIVAVAAEAALTACDAENASLRELLKSAVVTIERLKNGR